MTHKNLGMLCLASALCSMTLKFWNMKNMQHIACIIVSRFFLLDQNFKFYLNLFPDCADVGGLLGFFLGCSILSFIEIVYFLFENCLSKLKDRFIKRGKNGNKKNAMWVSILIFCFVAISLIYFPLLDKQFQGKSMI